MQPAGHSTQRKTAFTLIELLVVISIVALLVAILLGWEMTWWLTTVCIGGFLGGCATLVLRMRTDDEEDDPGRGAVV